MTGARARGGSTNPSCNMIRRGVYLALLLSFVIVAVANASPPPPNQRAWWAAPELYYLNTSDAGVFIATDSHSSIDRGVIVRPPFLPNVSENFYYSNFTSPDTGEQYLVAI